MVFDTTLIILIIIGLLVIGGISEIPVIRPLVDPVKQLFFRPRPDQKYFLIGIWGITILGLIAILIAAFTFLLQGDTDSTNRPNTDAYPSTPSP